MEGSGASPGRRPRLVPAAPPRLRRAFVDGGRLPGVPRGDGPPPVSFAFDPDRVAKLETEMWRSYYDKQWLRVLYLTERTSAVEFHIPPPLSFQAAYYATRAALAFKPLDNDVPKTLVALEGYYRLVRRFSGLTFAAFTSRSGT